MAAIPACGSAVASFDVEDGAALDFLRRPYFDPRHTHLVQRLVLGGNNNYELWAL
jgi:hypothetical protein